MSLKWAGSSGGFTVNRKINIKLITEEVAFQLTSTEYQLFYNVAAIDYVRYIGCDLASISIVDNPSPVKNLVKRLSEVSSWITHVLIS